MLVDVARRTTPTVAVVLPPGTMEGIGSGLPLGMIMTEAIKRRIFAEVATVTDGSVVSTSRGESLAGTFRRVLDDFRSSYVLHYIARRCPKALSSVGSRCPLEARAFAGRPRQAKRPQRPTSSSRWSGLPEDMREVYVGADGILHGAKAGAITST